MKHVVSVEAYFREHPPHSSPEAMRILEELTGIKRSRTQRRKCMNKLGMKFIKVGQMQIPAKIDVEEQERFKNIYFFQG
jgi:hypothetical protein